MRDYSLEPLQVLSLGGGTQSTAMILMIQAGLLEKPDLVIFADTGAEMPYTIDMIARCKEIVLEQGIDWATVRSPKGDLHEVYHASSGLPLIGFRTCTTEWKIRPIYRKIREYVGMGRGKVLAASWLGITTDESHRARESEHLWIERKYPLIDLGYSRQDCVKYCEDLGFQVEKSGCFMCPYQRKAQWEILARDHPELFDFALDMERRAKANGFTGGLYRSNDSIERFNHSHTLADFGMTLEKSDHQLDCDPGGSCFL